jgi:hypothetical protein
VIQLIELRDEFDRQIAAAVGSANRHRLCCLS